MIEEVVRDYLAGRLDTGVYLEVPQKETDFVVVEKTGSSEENLISRATVAVQSYGHSLFEAAQLNMRTIDAMKDIIELDDISSCDLISDYNFTDTETKRYRYQAVFDIVYY